MKNMKCKHIFMCYPKMTYNTLFSSFYAVVMNITCLSALVSFRVHWSSNLSIIIRNILFSFHLTSFGKIYLSIIAKWKFWKSFNFNIRIIWYLKAFLILMLCTRRQRNIYHSKSIHIFIFHNLCRVSFVAFTTYFMRLLCRN